MTDRRYPKSVRMLKQADFDRAFHAKVFAADDTLVVNAAANGLELTRLGLSVSRKVGNAVVRNAWKRRIREAFRLQRVDLPVGLDVVFRPKAGAVCDAAAIHKSLPELVRRVARKLRVRKAP